MERPIWSSVNSFVTDQKLPERKLCARLLCAEGRAKAAESYPGQHLGTPEDRKISLSRE